MTRSWRRHFISEHVIRTTLSGGWENRSVNHHSLEPRPLQWWTGFHPIPRSGWQLPRMGCGQVCTSGPGLRPPLKVWAFCVVASTRGNFTTLMYIVLIICSVTSSCSISLSTNRFSPRLLLPLWLVSELMPPLVEQVFTGTWFSTAVFRLRRGSVWFSAGLTYQRKQGVCTILLPVPVDELLFNLFFRPQFMAMYFNQPDHNGHTGGPDSELVGLAI